MANAVDLLTLTEAKAALNITGSGTDTEIEAYVTAVSQQLDRLCGPIVTRTLTSESHDGGCHVVYLDSRPVSSVTAVSEFSSTTEQALTAESNSSQTANQYLLDAAAGLLRRRSAGSDSTYATGRQNVVATYVAGRYSSTSTVDERFKTAARLTLTNMWRRDQGAGSETFGGLPTMVIPGFALPNAVLDLLADDIQAPEVA